MMINYSIENLVEKSSKLPFFIEITTLNKDFNLHTHNFSELIIVLEGSAVHVIDNAEYTISSGDVYVLNGDTAHGFKEIKNLKIVNVMYDCKMLLFEDESLKQLVGFQALFLLEPIYRKEYAFKAKLKLDSPNYYLVTRLINTMLEEFHNKEEGWEYILRSYFNELIVHLSRMYNRSIDSAKLNLYKFAELAVFIEQNFNKCITISQLAQSMGFSERHFNRIFTNLYHCSPMEHIIMLRLKYSCKLLKEDNLSITDIAVKCGFNDSNYFSRQFKKHYGVTPSELRKNTAVN